METKAILRKKILEIRKNLTREEVINYSNNISESLRQLPEFETNETVLGYMAIRNEVDIWSFLCKVNNKRLAMPKCFEKGHMEFFEISGTCDLEKGAYGIMEPKISCPLLLEEEGIILVPGVAFDKKGYRMGYGGGYYDRYLISHPGLIRVGLAFELQLCQTTYNEEYDQKMDYIITEREILHYDRS